MVVWHAPSDVPSDLAASVVTIGVFDGVHWGHQAVVGRAAAHARRLRIPVVAVTFDPNPIVVIRPEAAPPALLVPREPNFALRRATCWCCVGREVKESAKTRREVIASLLHAKAVGLW